MNMENSAPQHFFSDALWREKETAQFLGYKNHRTLANRRCKRLGPPYIRIGRNIRYSKQAVLEWLEKHKVEPEPK
jgi:predicted DNA-binding transcriptional regulator AlpA